MIQPAALPAVPGLLPLGEVLPAIVAEGLETADFGALLAVQAKGLAPPGGAQRMPAAMPPELPAPLPEAADLPEGGNPLPVALPVAFLPGPSEVTPAPAPQSRPAPNFTAETPQRGATRPVLEDQPTRPSRTARQAAVAEPASKPESEEGEAPLQAEPRIAALLAQTLETASAHAAAIAIPPAETPLELQAQPPGHPVLAFEPEPGPAPIEAPELPDPAQPRPALVAQSHVRHTQTELVVQAAPGELSQPAQSPVAPAAFAPITLSIKAVSIAPAPPIGEPQLHLTLPASGPEKAPEGMESRTAEPRLALAAIVAERPRVPGKAVPVAPPELALPAAEPVAPVTTHAAPAVLTLPALSAFSPADPALRPHDFVALVDRLVAARELVQPQAFQVAVQHGEFGRIQLRFQREGEGLNITMASADPDFARAVNAAPPPLLLPVTVTDPAAGQGGARSDSPSQSAFGNGGPAQNRGGTPERREDRHGPADNPVPARPGEGRDPRRSGIFA